MSVNNTCEKSSKIQTNFRDPTLKRLESDQIDKSKTKK